MLCTRLLLGAHKRASCVLTVAALILPLSSWGSSLYANAFSSLPLATMSLAPATSSVRAGTSTTIAATRQGAPVVGGTWSVVGGATFGTVTSAGVFTAPAVTPLIDYSIVHFVSGLQSADTIIQLLNPAPTITGTSVKNISAKVTSVTVTGAGFIAASRVMGNGTALPTTYVDASHLSVTVTLPAVVPSAVVLQVSNPAPGAATSSSMSMPVAMYAVSPASLSAGNISITVTNSAGIPSGTSVTLDGIAWATTGQTSTTITASGYLAPWKAGTVAVALLSGSTQSASFTVPITATAVPFDTASRFATQVAFGPRLDVIAQIQQVGLAAYIDQQESTTPDPYNLQEGPRTHFMRATLSANDLLRKRMGWAFQIMIPEYFINFNTGLQPWQTTMEAHAFGSYRQILQDAMSNAVITSFLSLPNNFASSDPTIHPNQNFGREVMQLFSVGTVLLNEDGTPALNASGQTQATYTQNDVDDSSRALTGWTYPTPVNAAFTASGVDYSLPLTSVESGHDHGSKTVLGVTLPAGQTAVQDRSQLLDILFNHPNLPPFVCTQLIQRLVKSQPSPAYVKRIVQVFKNDGTGVRGNLGAVVKAIYLDPEARAGDTTAGTTDGFVQEPLYQQIAAMSLLGITYFDDQPTYDPGSFKENYWFANSIFSYFSPTYLIPGTAINSPEFEIIDTITVTQRSQFMWGIVTGTATGIPGPSTQLFTTFPDLTSMMDALNHILFHGAMPQTTHDAIVAYCSTITDPNLQLQSAVFLALNSDNYNVAH